MADVTESVPITDPLVAIAQGKRHLLVGDYSLAVTALAQACELLAEKHGDTADELGEPYLLYGRALLLLAREETGVLGGAVPGSEDAETEEDAEEEEGDEKSSVAKKDDTSDEAKITEEAAGDKDKSVETKEEKKDDAKDEVPVASTADAKSSNTKEEKKDHSKQESEAKADSTTDEAEAAKDKKVEQKSESKDSVKEDKPVAAEPNKTDDCKVADEKKEKLEEKPDSTESDKKTDAPSTSSSNADKPTTNGNAKGAQNGVESENEEDEEGEESEDVNKEEDEDDVNNLQLAWEVLELAKLVLLKRGPPGWKQLSEAHQLLGEVAMEDGNHEGAGTDLQACLDIMEKIEPQDRCARTLAQVHYQFGLAHSLANDFDASIEQFKKATALLESRIKELEETKDPPKSTDSFYTVEGEIKELKELLPEIQDKIADMKDFKQETCKAMIEGIKNKVAAGSTNGAGPSSSADGAGSSADVGSSNQKRAASDISHLVRKKRKTDETGPEAASPVKKPTPEKAP